MLFLNGFQRACRPKIRNCNTFVYYKAFHVNPLALRRTQVSPFTEISILFLEGIIENFFLRPILGYVPKNDEKKNLVHKGFKY